MAMIMRETGRILIGATPLPADQVLEAAPQ
jgi:hypothetical protein